MRLGGQFGGRIGGKKGEIFDRFFHLGVVSLSWTFFWGLNLQYL